MNIFGPQECSSGDHDGAVVAAVDHVEALDDAGQRVVIGPRCAWCSEAVAESWSGTATFHFPILDSIPHP